MRISLYLNSGYTPFIFFTEDRSGTLLFSSSSLYSLCSVFRFYFVSVPNMLLRNSPHKDSKKDSPLKSQGIIKDSPTERCCFSDAHVDKIRHCFPANAVFKSFDPTALSDFVSDVWVAFPATPFAIGYSYPFPDFTQSFLRII